MLVSSRRWILGDALSTSAFDLCLLAVADLREVRAGLTQSQHEIWRDLARLVATKVQREKPAADPENNGGSR